MNPTRINSAELKQAVEQGSALFEQLETLLAPYLLLLKDAERQEMPKAREGFDEAGRAVARAVLRFPKIAQVADCDAGAIVEDLDNVAAITPLAERAAALSQRLADSRLTWTAEAWVPSLTVYGVAKVVARNDATVREIIQPLAKVFATRRQQKEKKEE